MKKGAKLLEGTHDFSTFRASSCSAKNPIRTVKSIKIKENKIVKRVKKKEFFPCIYYILALKNF